MMRIIAFIAMVAILATSCKVNSTNKKVPETSPTVEQATRNDVIVKSDEEWKSVLTDQQFYVMRQAGTERAFTSELLTNKSEGVYECAACHLPLFSSRTKFKSGTGWPSYYEPIGTNNVAEKVDVSHGMHRTEVLCARCGGHLGHVFNDGPQPTGLRYCINGVALDFKEDETP